MKKCLLLLAALGSCLVTMAQDLIVKTDSTRIEARVDEISTDQIRYKRFARLEGPTYVVPIAQVCYIRYADGFFESYNRTATPVVAPAPAAPAVAEAPAAAPAPTATFVATTPAAAPAPAPAPAAYETKAAEVKQVVAQSVAEESVDRYELGQLYDRNGVRGIVVALNEDRTHGLVMSVDQTMASWSVFRKGNYRLVGASDKMDGEKNMAIVAEYIAKENLSWDDFPAFKWCREKGEGWYLPSIDEVLTIGNNYNGGNRQHNDRHTRSRWNDNIRLAGGSRIDMKRIYYSSTETSDALAMMGVMGIDLPYLYNTTADPKEPIQKYVTFIVRAVHKF